MYLKGRTSRQEKGREMLGGWGGEWRVVREAGRRRASQRGDASGCDLPTADVTATRRVGEDRKITRITARGQNDRQWQNCFCFF